MTRSQEETSTSQVGRRKGSSRDSTIASSLVASMSVEKLRSFRDPNNISLELLVIATMSNESNMGRGIVGDTGGEGLLDSLRSQARAHRR